MKIGIMGGTFDPIHMGHIEMAEQVQKRFALDKMIFMTSGDPPHKNSRTDKRMRLEMVKLAMEGHPYFEASDIEVNRRGTTYTVDTLAQLQKNDKGSELFYVIGSDTLKVIRTWYRFEQVARMCTLVVVKRSGEEERLLRVWIRTLEEEYGAKILCLPDWHMDISSTMVRDRLQSGADAKKMVPDKVLKYIRKKGLYRPMDETEMLEKLKKALPEKRLTHSLGVRDTAVRLAKIHGIDEDQARIAGLLHDCAKKMSRAEMLKVLAENGVDLSEDEKSNDSLLHAPAGSVIARRDYAQTDPEILSAIRKHTVGSAHMTPLECLIYVSDFIEPGRKSFPGLEEVRKAAEEDLFRAARMSAELTVKFVSQNGGVLNPATLDLLRES